MGRQYVAAFGLALVSLFGLFAALLASEDPVRPLALAPALANVLAGLLLIVGGLVDDVRVGSRRIRWFHLLGAAIVLHGTTWFAFGVQDLLGPEPTAMPFGPLVYAASGVVFLWIGADFLRGGVHHDLSVLE